MNQLYDSALLADAAYLFFNQGLYNTGTGEIDLQVASVFKDRGFTQDQFTYLRDTYKVKAHLPNTVTGLSLTIFENKNTRTDHRLSGDGAARNRYAQFLQDLFRDIIAGRFGFDTLTGASGGIRHRHLPARCRVLDASGAVPATGPLTGHSLGGHLSMVTALNLPGLAKEVSRSMARASPR